MPETGTPAATTEVEKVDAPNTPAATETPAPPPEPVGSSETPPATPAEAASDESPAESLDGDSGVLGDVQLAGPEEPLQESFTDESKTAESMRGMRWGILTSLVMSACAIRSSGADVSSQSLVTERLFLGDGSNPLVARLAEVLEAIATPPAEIANTPNDIRAAWISLSRKALTLARETFASLPGMDQDENAVLHALANSTASPAIIADLARQVAGASIPQLTPQLLGNLLNGNQSKELSVIGVAPERIVPLVNVVYGAAATLNLPVS